jgi:hypothetical protein
VLAPLLPHYKKMLLLAPRPINVEPLILRYTGRILLTIYVHSVA